MLHQERNNGRYGFTLVELLVGIAVIGILLALILPAVQSAREAARRIQCRNNLKQIGLALHNYADAHRIFPISWGETRWEVETRTASWLALILPYVDQKPLYDTIDFEDPLAPGNQAAAATPVPVYLCPSDSTAAVRNDRNRAQGQPVGFPVAITSYRGVAGSNWGAGTFVHTETTGRNSGRDDAFRFGNGIFTGGYLEPGFWGPPIRTRPADIRDGMSNTVATGESVADWCSHAWWFWHNWPNGTMAIPLNYCAPREDCYDDWPHNFGFHSRHTGGGHFLYADGSVKFISDTIDRGTYRAIGTISGAEVIDGSAGG